MLFASYSSSLVSSLLPLQILSHSDACSCSHSLFSLFNFPLRLLPIHCGIVLARNAIAFPYIERSRTGNSSYTGSSVHVLMFSCHCLYSFLAPRHMPIEEFSKIKTIFFDSSFSNVSLFSFIEIP